MKPHYLYLFIGNSIADLNKTKIRFVIQTKKLIEDHESVEGTVVGASPNSPHPVGTYSRSWANPVRDMIVGLYPSFVRIPYENAVSMFPDNAIADPELYNIIINK